MNPSLPAAGPLLDEVTLRGMRFHALVGVLPHERTIHQPLEVDLTVWVASGQAVLDYRELYDAVRDEVEKQQMDFLEHGAQRIAARVLSDRRARYVRVVLRKPHVALPGPLASAEVVVTRAASV